MSHSATKTFNYGFFAVLLAATLWGTTGTAAHFAPGLSPLAVGALAMGGGGLLQALLAVRQITLNRNRLAAHIPLLCAGVISVAIYPLAFYSSMRLAGVTIGTVVSIGTAPLFSALLERYFENKRLSRVWMVSFVLGIIGVLLLCLDETRIAEREANSTLKLIGTGLGVLAGATYALYSWVAKRLIDSGIAAKAAMGAIFGIGALILLATLFFTATNLFSSTSNVVVAGYMALIPMFLGYVLFGYGLKTIPTSKAVTLTLFEPVVAAVLAMIVIGETLSVLGWAGMLSIFLCIVLLSRAD